MCSAPCCSGSCDHLRTMSGNSKACPPRVPVRTTYPAALEGHVWQLRPILSSFTVMAPRLLSFAGGVPRAQGAYTPYMCYTIQEAHWSCWAVWSFPFHTLVLASLADADFEHDFVTARGTWLWYPPGAL